MKFKANKIISIIFTAVIIVLIATGVFLHYTQYFGANFYYDYFDYLNMGMREVQESWLTFYYTDLLVYIPSLLLIFQLVLLSIYSKKDINLNREELK